MLSYFFCKQCEIIKRENFHMICLWQIHVATQLIGCNMLVDSSMHYLLQKLAGMGNNEIDL